MRPSSSDLRITYVLPIYNEENRLEQLFATLVPVAEAMGGGFELLCVDDGSRDASLPLLREAAKREPRIRVEALPENRGKGAAVRHGMLAARGEFVVFMDADLSTDLGALGPMVEALERGTPVVLGLRHGEHTRIVRAQPWLRKNLGRVFRVFSSLVFAPEVQDFTCGFKGFRAEAVREIFTRSIVDRWAFDVELVVIARARGFAIEHVPVVWENFEDTKVRLFNAILSSLRDLARIQFYRATGRYRRAGSIGDTSQRTYPSSS